MPVFTNSIDKRLKNFIVLGTILENPSHAYKSAKGLASL